MEICINEKLFDSSIYTIGSKGKGHPIKLRLRGKKEKKEKFFEKKVPRKIG